MEATMVMKSQGVTAKRLIPQNSAQAEKLLTPAEKLAAAKKEVETLKLEAREEAKKLKLAKEAERQARAEAKATKTAKVTYTRAQAAGEVMRQNPEATPEVLATMADAVYCEKTGHGSNVKESRSVVNFGLNFLLGYGKE